MADRKKRLTAKMKFDVYLYGIQSGLSQKKVCTILKIDERRIQRWRKEAQSDKL